MGLAAIAAAAALLPAVPVPPDVTVVYGACPVPGYATVAGCTWKGSDDVYVMDAGDVWSPYHELGHQFAFRVLGDSGQGPLVGTMGKFARMTRPTEPFPRVRSVVREEFADAYASCALRLRPNGNPWRNGENFPTGYGYNPTPRIHRQVCDMIRRAAARRGLT